MKKDGSSASNAAEALKELRGSVIRYSAPTDPVDEEWEALSK